MGKITASDEWPTDREEGIKEAYRVLRALNTDNPSPKDVTKYRAFLDREPDLWRLIGDMTATMSDRMLKQVLPKNGETREALKYGRDKLLDDLGYPKATGLEKTLIEHIGFCWLHLQITVARYTMTLESNPSASQALYLERHLSQVQTRYLRATEALARVRRLLRSDRFVQVNIAAEGGQQVNVNQASEA